MSEVEDHWFSEECRVEDGIYFADDTYVPLAQNVPQLPRRSVEQLLRIEPDAWSSVYPGEPLALLPGHVVLGGATSWEGAGFLALVRESDGSLVWLLHSSESEAFLSASVQGDLLVATSSEYPSNFRWEIPIDAPWSLKVLSHDA
jgi:hypothetical protein